MKLYTLMLIFATALFCLFSLQAFWLYHSYQLHLASIKKKIDNSFIQTIEKELDKRHVELDEKAKNNLLNPNIGSVSFKIDYNSLESKGVVSQHIDMVKQLMATHDIHFNIISCDSILNSLLQANNYPFKYQINLIDSAGKVIKTAGHPITKGFKTSVLPVIDGDEVYAIVKITAPAVFRDMLAILTVSVLIFLLIIGCLIYEIKVFLDQHHLIRLRENFTSALTHEMRTPLSTIHSVLSQFEKGEIDQKPLLKKKFCSIAIEQVLNLQTTINQILTLAYIEKKQLTLNKQSVDLPAMFQSLFDNFSLKTAKKITFETNFELGDIIVYADEYYLKNVFSNLIDNAIKYSAESVTIEVKCTAGEKYIFIHLKDNGLGISAKDQLKIFNRFERGAEIDRNCVSGFGIGLNYVQRVIEAHGGHVTLISQENAGCEFTIALPLHLEEEI